MKKQIWAAGAALTIPALALPYGAAFAAAEDVPAMTAQVTKATSSSRQTSSEVTVAGTWATPKLTVGQAFTVSTKPTNGGAPFTWAASFPFMLDDGSVVGECVADQATLTCTVREVPDAYKDKADVKGTWWARARLQDAAVGTNEGTITLNGEAVNTLVWGDKDGTGECTNDCSGPAHYEYANPENIKFGWTNDNGTIGWGIKWIANGGVEYTVKDFDTRLNTSVKCAKSDTWDPDTTENITATQVDENTIRFTAPDGVKTCIVYPPEQMKVPEGQTSVTNHAEINGMKLESTATVRSNGGTDGDGTVKPTPTPAPTPTSPATEPTPEPTPTTPAPKPSDEPQSAPTPTPAPTSDTVKPTPAPASTPTTEQPKPTPAPTTAPAPQQRLAKTGATTNGLLLMIAAIMGGAGAGLLILRLLEGPASKKVEEL
nr:MAG TPA: PR-1 protein fever, LIPID BINDING PROTEIN [Caudoviricetes sp.]